MGDIAARPQEILAGLERQAEHNYQMLLTENERLSRELERAKLLYNDLARENEALREAGQMTPEVLKKYCDNARAYGWEAGRAYGLASSVDKDIPKLELVYNSHPSNPFINPDWDADLKIPQGFMVTAKDNQL